MALALSIDLQTHRQVVREEDLLHATIQKGAAQVAHFNKEEIFAEY